jgi:hypothetical protein
MAGGTRGRRCGGIGIAVSGRRRHCCRRNTLVLDATDTGLEAIFVLAVGV